MILGFYVCFNFIFQGEFRYFANEIKSGQAGVQPKIEHCPYSCSFRHEHCLHSSRFYSQILGNDPEYLIDEKERAPCCDAALDEGPPRGTSLRGKATYCLINSFPTTARCSSLPAAFRNIHRTIGAMN